MRCQGPKRDILPWLQLWLSLGLWLLLLLSAGAALAGSASLAIVGETFTYSDAQRTFTGRILQPPGPGPHPVIVFMHGQGGTPSTYPNLEVFRSWGAIAIAPTLTHVAGGETAPETTGQCPENLARGQSLVAVLATQPFVDPARIAVFGHSKGAYASIAQVAALGSQVRVAALTAGGIVPDSAGTAQAAPTAGEALGITAPYLMMHGSIDGAVAPARSLALFEQLQSLQVPARRVVYPVEPLTPNEQHNLHLDPDINAALLAETLSWYTQWGLFGDGVLLADGFESN